MNYGTGSSYSEEDREIERLTAERDAALVNVERYKKLLMAVGKKYPGESRYETALRYIRRAENQCNNAAIAKEVT